MKKLHHSYEIVDMFERTVADYTGAPFAVAVDCCTNGIQLSLEYVRAHFAVGDYASIPKRTYLSVPQAISCAGMGLKLRDEEWLHRGHYEIEFDKFVNGTPSVYDAAKLLTSGMYIPGSMMVLSFHIKKSLPIGKGGMILLDNAEAAKWLKERRYEGRQERVSYHVDPIPTPGYNMYMDPVSAARGLFLMDSYPEHNEPQGEEPNYRNLSDFEFVRKLIFGKEIYK